MTDNKKGWSTFEIGAFSALGKAENGRLMLGEALGLTGCEISFNIKQAGEFVPFVHTHTLNEEVYIVLSGSGMFYAGGEEFPIKEGSTVRVAPECPRAISAGSEALTYICIQAQNGSLEQATSDDGVLKEEKASWM